MGNNKLNIIKYVVNQDFCIGCGMCAYVSQGALTMRFNDYGFITPAQTEAKIFNENDIDVCPFNPFPNKAVRTENELSDIFVKGASKHSSEMGRYTSLYAGYSKEHRPISSSGGLATQILIELLKGGKIDVVGAGCFIRAVRLAQFKDPVLNRKIVFTIGIICGGIKSAFFAGYLASRVGIYKNSYKQPEFRVKDPQSTSSDYSFRCKDVNTGEKKTLKMNLVGDVCDMWGTGSFKSKACNFCDDVTSEFAYIFPGNA